MELPEAAWIVRTLEVLRYSESRTPEAEDQKRRAAARSLTALFTGLCMAIGMAAPALSQSFPSRPIMLFIGVPPGGAADINARSRLVARTNFFKPDLQTGTGGLAC